MISKLFENNVEWSRQKHAENPNYFSALSHLQTPEYLWIGCSDSRVPANVITGLEPGQVFVHRNVANLIHPTDLTMLSVVEYAVRQLKVRHIIVCGHYGCGGIRAAVDGTRLGVVDHWLEPIREVAGTRLGCRSCDAPSKEMLDRLSELSVVEQVNRLALTPILQEAWKADQTVAIHGWIYGLDDGLLKDLNCSIGPPGA
jgi:carbonic anhydrase